jgi:hypothetical protein
MTILDTTSLVSTLDHTNAKFLLGETIPAGEGLKTARWIASRLGEKGSYRGMFAPTPADFEQGVHVFTGEKLVCASARHIMGQEASRVVWLLGRQDALVRKAYEQATRWMHEEPYFLETGLFCCGRCTLAYWRHFSVGDFKNKEALLLKGIKKMQEYRLANGKWRRFPFFYTIYTLVDLDFDPALSELRYARPAMEKYLKISRKDLVSQRKAMILEKAMEKIN